MVTFIDLLEEHAAASLEKQWALADLVGDLDWFVDLDEGTLKFGDQYEFPVQVLGSESYGDGTWLWAWANEESNIPARLLTCANDLRKLGEREGIRELYQEELELDELDGTRIALVAAGICGLGGYYQAPYEGGAVFLLLETPLTESPARPNAVRMINVFLQVISALQVDHRRAFSAYVKQKGFSLEATATGLLARSAGGQALMADFDSNGMLLNLQTVVQPSTAG
jgi:hypothetical protein